MLDYANIDRAARDRNQSIDYKALLDYLASEVDGRYLVEAFCYFPVDPRNPHARDQEIDELSMDGFFMRTKLGTIAGDTHKCNFDVEITMDMMRVAHVIKPTILVLCSGDGDFVPAVQYVRSMGVRVELASFIDTTARAAILNCSSFVDLDVYLRGSIEGGPQSEPQGADTPAAS
jgi:uncharacterized LabA/DUF88 family protein